MVNTLETGTVGVRVTKKEGRLVFDWPVLLATAMNDFRLMFERDPAPDFVEGGLALPDHLYNRIAGKPQLLGRVEDVIGFRFIPVSSLGL